LREEAWLGWSVGGGIVPLLGATIGMTKIEGKWGIGLRWPKFYGHKQQPAKS
jgi:hypothetical protein